MSKIKDFFKGITAKEWGNTVRDAIDIFKGNRSVNQVISEGGFKKNLPGYQDPTKTSNNNIAGIPVIGWVVVIVVLIVVLNN